MGGNVILKTSHWTFKLCQTKWLSQNFDQMGLGEKGIRERLVTLQFFGHLNWTQKLLIFVQMKPLLIGSIESPLVRTKKKNIPMLMPECARGWYVHSVTLFQEEQRNTRKSIIKNNQNGQRPQTNAIRRVCMLLEASYSYTQEETQM